MKRPREVIITAGGSDLASRAEKLHGALTASELAASLNRGKGALHEMAAKSRIPSIKICATARFDPARIAAWLRQREVRTDRRAA
jgi:hypothetical protein